VNALDYRRKHLIAGAWERLLVAEEDRHDQVASAPVALDASELLAAVRPREELDLNRSLLAKKAGGLERGGELIQKRRIGLD